ncbi:uncharacterized protein LOC121375741 isoform X2 [Gigantopelta aegis]|uniref:uncharacterized protein LOC121375741 isoform X2 n=1 Tax=Gigantopelta aegis TaxID=1735272 RepID=UPI001B88E6B0|nr:uncharacterized protein LOC121375741 isoform X2 [Gigantopelta aegis]
MFRVIPLRRKDEDKENIFKIIVQSDCYVLKTLHNQSAIAQNKENGLYYPGVVKSCCTNDHVTVQFTATGTEHVIPTCFVIPISGAIAVPTLKVRDCVLERVFSLALEMDCYVPGIVEYISCPTQHPTVYTVILYNKQKVLTTRINLVKISPITYNFTVKHIRLHQSGSDVSYRSPNSKALNEDDDVSKKDPASISRRPVIEDKVVKEKRVTKSPRLKLRNLLPKVKVKTEVLAKWPDDCWYYKGTILSCDNYLYQVEDSMGDVEQIWRENIITYEDDGKNIIQVNDYVVAAYPAYCLSYAPGQVVRDLPDKSMEVRFYDFEEGTVSKDQVFKLSQHKYRYDVEDIHRCENRWVGTAAVVRNDVTGVYVLANVKEKDRVGQNYTIEWPDCSHSPETQNPIHIFGAFTQHPPLKENGYVLAIANDKTMEYLPGQVTHIHKSTDSFDVAFCDGTVKKIPLDRNLYYCLNKTYYDQAVAYFLDMKRCDSFLI